MNVSELIKKLQEFPGHLDVVFVSNMHRLRHADMVTEETYRQGQSGLLYDFENKVQAPPNCVIIWGRHS